MKSIRLSFGVIYFIKDNLAEVIIDEGVVMDDEMVAKYFETLHDHLVNPYYLLINNQNSYSYSLSAQVSLANLEFVQAFAVVAPNSASQMAIFTLVKTGNNSGLNLEIFKTREKALEWLLAYEKNLIQTF